MSRYAAFCTIDTDFKKEKGGKGVGRLFWLDAFESIRIDSIYVDNGKPKARSFGFKLNNDDQILPIDASPDVRTGSGTKVAFAGFRAEEYAHHFPRRTDTFLRHFSAHFIADFLMGSGPDVVVEIDGSFTHYPKEVAELVVGVKLESGPFESPDFGSLSIIGFACYPTASTGLDGNHQLHLLANGRTVESRKIDNLMGLKTLSRDGVNGLYLHGCVSGDYLDKRVNEGRTAFNIPEKILKELSRQCVNKIKEAFFPE